MRAPLPRHCQLARPQRASMGRATVVALLTLLLAAPAQAQFMELNPGTRIRLRTPPSVAGQATGVVIARSRDSLTVSRCNAMPVTLPLSALTSLDISRGKSHGLGAKRGALWGGGVFLGLALVIPDEKCVDGIPADDC